MKGELPLLAVSIGCPSGIGPEVSVMGASRVEGARVLLVGDLDVIRRAAVAVKLDPRRFVLVERAAEAHALPRGATAVRQPSHALSRADARRGAPSVRGGEAQLRWVDVACDLVRDGEAAALVTGPVSKEVISRSASREAKRFLGHTEHLQRRLAAQEVIMAFHCEAFTTALVTTHVALARVPRLITPTAVATASFWLGDLLVRLSSRKKRPRIAVASLNPHAGEGGLLGHEETDAIEPGMALARKRLARRRVACDLVGPVPAETAFRVAARGGYDGVVAMYHDQATIPMKLVGFGEAVNVSLGLPIIRTSVDHGTGYDIAGSGVADPRGMLEAMKLAVRLIDGGTPRTRRRAP
jgi:4-hydroxythreonine-4-phosphate dehydrogenase